MSLIFIIDNVEITSEDVISYPQSQEVVTMGTTNQLLPSDLTLTLDNINGDYDDRLSTSLFFGTSWYNSELDIYDDVENIYIWKGIVKTITVDESNKVVSVYSVNFIQSIAETLLVYASTTNVTPAEHIYNILIDVVGLESSKIDISGFNEAISIQETNSVYCNINYVAGDNMQALSVISELCRITQCDLYSENNQIRLKQWQEYDGTLGTLIENKNIEAGQYKHYFDESVVYNSFSVKYDSSGTIAESTGSNSTSQNTYGVRYFTIPNQAIDSTTSSEYKILLKSSTAALWAGNLAITRFQDFIKYFEITTGEELDTIGLTSLVDLTFDGMTREPARMIEKSFNTDEKKIKFKGYYVNTPHQFYARDTTAPDAPTIVSTLPYSDGSIIIKYTQNFETDFIGYKIYFTTTNGEWEADFCNLGQSPIDIKNPGITADGYFYTIISQLSIGTEYNIKIKAYDSSLNLSEFSNTIKVVPAIGTEDFYMLTGDIYFSGLTLDNSNPLDGTPLTGLSGYYDVSLYGTGLYTYAASYQGKFESKDNFTYVKFWGSSESGTIYYQYDQSDDDVVWDGWSSITQFSGTTSQSLSKKYFKIRFLYSPVLWGDSDKIYIQEVI